MRTVKVAEFTKFPGPRYSKLGSYSGEEFRDKYLIPAMAHGAEDLVVDLDGVFGFGSSFLEEAFGGLVRKGLPEKQILFIIKNLKSDDDPSLLREIEGYVKAQLEND